MKITYGFSRIPCTHLTKGAAPLTQPYIQFTQTQFTRTVYPNTIYSYILSQHNLLVQFTPAQFTRTIYPNKINSYNLPQHNLLVQYSPAILHTEAALCVAYTVALFQHLLGVGREPIPAQCSLYSFVFQFSICELDGSCFFF